jgi:hypothetical protein
MKKGNNIILNLIFILSLILIVSCTQESSLSPKGIDLPIDEEIDIVKVETKEKQTKRKTIETKDNYYDIKQLEKDYNDIINTDKEYSEFIINNTYLPYIINDLSKTFVVHTISEQDMHINNVVGYCNSYCGENGLGWRFLSLNPFYENFHVPFVEEDFSNENRYHEYLSDRIVVERHFEENSFVVENGVINEFQNINFERTFNNNFNHGLFATLLYQVYCSPNMTIVYRPGMYKRFNDVFGTPPIDFVLNDWDEYVEKTRVEMLEIGNKLLDRCPVEKVFFDDFSFQPFSKIETIAYYWRDWLENKFNLTTEIDIEVEPSSIEGEFVFKEVKVKFTNSDIEDLVASLAMRITVTPDDKNTKDYFDARAGEKLEAGKSVSRNVKKDKIKFNNNITIEASLYTVNKKQDIRPLKKTFTLQDLGLT